MRQISYMQAGMEALTEELRNDPMAFHMATDAPPALVEEFGSQRVRATPIAEGTLTGIALGAAGCRCWYGRPGACSLRICGSPRAGRISPARSVSTARLSERSLR